MVMISPGATIVALFVTALVYHAAKSRQLRSRWGDVRYGVLVQIARLALEALARRHPDARAWNPHVLVLTGTPSSRWHLVVIARALAGTSGLLTVATVVPEKVAEEAKRVDAIRHAIERHLETHQVPALVKVETDVDVVSGLIALVKSYGFGPLVPNTVLLGKAATPEDPVRHADLLTVIQRRRRNLIVVHEGEMLPALAEARRIHVWWRGHRGNLGLMLALAFLLRQDEVWAGAEIVVWRIVATDDEVEPATADLDEVLSVARFPATVRVVCEDGDPFDTIRRHAAETDLLFLGLRPRDAEESAADYAAYYGEMVRKTEGLPPTALVTAGEQVNLHRLFSSP
jgi:hypothetical protein